MAIARKTGLILFLAGTTLFLASFFLAHYRLTTEDLKNNIGDERKRSLLQSELSEVIDHEYTNSFRFIALLDDAFRLVNSDQLQTFLISTDEIDQLIASYTGGPFDVAALGNIVDTETETGRFKIKSLHDYGSWLNGRTYNEKDLLKQDLMSVVSNIEKYGVIGLKGFDKYQIKDLKYVLAKDAGDGPVHSNPGLFLFLTYGLMIIGGILFFIPGINALPGIKNNGIFSNPATNGGWIGIFTGTMLIAFYVVLYYFPEHMTVWISMVDPVSMAIKGSTAGRFFLYGFMYTLTILVMGVRMLIKYKHSKYHQVRTASVMFFQTAFAFLIPEILLRLNKPYFDFKNIWPLDYDFFFESEISKLVEGGTLGVFMLGWGVALIIVAVPVFVYFFGKRWYCSWVCGCGGLAETLGDPYRQLSDKSLKAWKVERWMIHSVLVFAVLMTAGVLYTYWSGNSQLFGFVNSYSIREAYGFWIGAGFAGVVGTGFYPFMGNRVWCRFGCPLAAYLGFVQRFKSRFRITTNGGQCISCGNCSTYCEMGIDVRWYAQRGQNIIRSSCVGCGVCSSVCPRGVLRLENGKEEGRFGKPILVGNNSIEVAQ